ncbi:MAG TPA: S-adenosylmethionine:tRNA ribosyltransferase-isomerase, partial [Polyangiales bacterium]|nr:S-adenosylmethionine:tRNA ribosyltransferase-isomerase [Polyangiales bacterium]
MKPAAAPRDDRDQTRLLVLDPCGGERQDARIAELPSYLQPGDLVVVNDAATLPGSLRAQTVSGQELELRLAGPSDDDRLWVVAFGPGDYHTRTEERAAPPPLAAGDTLHIGPRLRARVLERSAISPRLLKLGCSLAGAALWAELYARGMPVQYQHHDRDLGLWSVQTAYAARPWAAEMPSAGRPLSFATLHALQRRGVRLASLTHAAGISATGDAALDAALPLPERYDIPLATVRALDTARRVIAVGTSVVRALEGSAAKGGGVTPGLDVTELRIGPGFVPRVVTGLLTGMHSPGESHYALLRAFASEPQLTAASEHAERAGYLSHEFGDVTLVLAGTLGQMRRA